MLLAGVAPGIEAGRPAPGGHPHVPDLQQFTYPGGERVTPRQVRPADGASEVTRVAREVGTEGRLGVQAVVPGVAGTWKDLTDSVNTMGAT